MKELPERIHDDTNGLDYVLVGDYYIPHISMQTLIKICETLNCDIADAIALVPDDNP